MNVKEIKAIQLKIKPFYAPDDQAGCDDGKWGRKSKDALRAYLRSLAPKPNPWPSPDMASLKAFYGEPGDEGNLVAVTPPFPMYYEGKRVNSIRIHKKVAASLLRILTRIGEKFGKDRGIMEEAEDYGGAFNFRPKRGSSSWSLHAWGAAIDEDADDNSFRAHWPTEGDMPLEIIEEFAREGWTSGAGHWNSDPMHFEATSYPYAS